MATDDRLLFYTDAADEFGNEPMVDQIERELRERPTLERTELERRYRLTFRIAEVLRRMVPRVSFEVEPYSMGDFYDREWDTTQRFDSEYSEIAAVKAAFVPTPTIVCYSRDEVGPVYEVHVPRLERQEPIARRRGSRSKL